MSAHRIVFTIDLDGAVTAEVAGVKGSACEAVMAVVARATGLQIKHERQTGEFYEQPQAAAGVLKVGGSHG